VVVFAKKGKDAPSKQKDSSSKQKDAPSSSSGSAAGDADLDKVAKQVEGDAVRYFGRGVCGWGVAEGAGSPVCVHPRWWQQVCMDTACRCNPGSIV